MPKITFLPQSESHFEGKTVQGEKGKTILEVALENDIPIDHACEMACACTTCHVIIRKGFDSLTLPEECEDDLLDKAWGLTPNSRLSCQAIIGEEDLTVEIPKYTRNLSFE